MKLKNIHYYSGIVLTIFIGLHLFNHAMSIFGIGTHLAVMENLRLFYRNLLVETILGLAVLTQITSGIRLVWKKRKMETSFFERLQMWSGLYLAFFLVIHVSAILVGRFILKLDTNFYFGAAGLNHFPFNLFFIPYYGLAILSFFGHIASIHAQKMRKTILGFSPDQQAKMILVKGVLLCILIFYGLTNGFTGIELPAGYEVLIGK
ncbi:MAG: hypothetical protein AB8G15_01250 [Saprospiraceae bacterium]